MVPVHPCSVCRCSMKPSRITHTAVAPGTGTLQCFHTVLVLVVFRCHLKLSKPPKPSRALRGPFQDSRNVVWWSTEHPHPAWQRFRQIRRPEYDTVQYMTQLRYRKHVDICGQKYEKTWKNQTSSKKREELYMNEIE